MEFYFEGIKRLDWGFGNPNKTATVIASLMIAVWVLAYIRRNLFWIALPAFTFLGVCLVQTFSRGGALAVIVGLSIAIWKAPRPWSKLHVVSLTCSTVIISFAIAYLHAGTRFQKGLTESDASINNRLTLWSSAPRMMLDAPEGWGLGKSGRAYMEWYQPLDRNEGYRTLVNSHLTWLVEFGWPFRLLYIFGWGAVLLLCYPDVQRWFVIPFTIWIAFGISAFFSSVAECPWVWAVPGISLLAVLIGRIRFEWPTKATWLIPVSGTAIITWIIVSIGWGSKMLPLSFRSGVLRIRGNQDEFTIVTSSSVFGSYPGKILRKQLLEISPSAAPTFLIADSLKTTLPKNAKILVCGGALEQSDIDSLRIAVTNAEKVIFVNPFFSPAAINIQTDQLEKFKVVFGEFTQSPATRSWENITNEKRLRISGAGDFLPQWPTILIQNYAKYKNP